MCAQPANKLTGFWQERACRSAGLPRSTLQVPPLPAPAAPSAAAAALAAAAVDAVERHAAIASLELSHGDSALEGLWPLLRRHAAAFADSASTAPASGGGGGGAAAGAKAAGAGVLGASRPFPTLNPVEALRRSWHAAAAYAHLVRACRQLAHASGGAPTDRTAVKGAAPVVPSHVDLSEAGAEALCADACHVHGRLRNAAASRVFLARDPLHGIESLLTGRPYAQAP
jgi:hypothetical protein